jgi:hypothetical protein
MAEVTQEHRRLAHLAIQMGELHGQKQLHESVAQAICDAEERGRQQAAQILGQALVGQE